MNPQNKNQNENTATLDRAFSESALENSPAANPGFITAAIPSAAPIIDSRQAQNNAPLESVAGSGDYRQPKWTSAKRFVPLMAALVIVAVAAPIAILHYAGGKGNKPVSSVNNSNTSQNPQKGILQNNVSSINLNRPTIIADGSQFKATGQVQLQNQTDSTQAFSVQNAAGDILFNVDTANKKVVMGGTGKTITLQIAGAVSIDGNLSVNKLSANSLSAGGATIDSQGVTLGSLIVCTTAGCTPNTRDALTLQGQGSSFFTNATNINTGTLSDKRLSTNVALLNANQTFTGTNIFSNGANTVCPSGETLSQTTISGGIVTGGVCMPVTQSISLQQAYDVSSPATINLTNNKPITLQEPTFPAAADLFRILSNDGSKTYLQVASLGTGFPDSARVNIDSGTSGHIFLWAGTVSFVTPTIETTGDINFDLAGNTQQAIARAVFSSVTLAPHDVVVLDTANPGYVTTTTTPGSDKVVGVAAQSANPGSSVNIYISGTTQVNVDSSAVNIGDYLVTSATAGHATVSAHPLNGTVVGRALSSKTAGSPGTVWVSLNPGSGGADTLQSAYDNSSSPATITTSSPTKSIIFKAGTGNDSANLFQVQDASGADVLVADTQNGRVGIGTSSPTDVLSVVGNSSITQSPASAPSVTASGNEINDSVRQTGLQGDGRAVPDSSYGIWAPTTNLEPNGGFENNQTGWISSGSATTSTDNTTAKFGSVSLKAVTNGVASGEGVTTGTNGTLGMGAVVNYTASTWVKGSGTVTLTINEYDSSHNFLKSDTSSLVTLSSSWQRVTVSFTSHASAAYGDISVVTNGTQATTFWVDGVQLEQLPVATPYVDTNGSTATRNGGRVQIPETDMNATQGWVATRIRFNLPDNICLEGGTERILEWAVDDNNRILLTYTCSAARFEAYRIGSGITMLSTQNYTFNAGDIITVVMAWTSSSVKLSVNGSSFAVTPGAAIPDLSSATMLSIGTTASLSGHLDGDIMWFAAGTGTMTDSDPASLYAMGNTDPNMTSFSASEDADMVWQASNAFYFNRTYQPVVLNVRNSLGESLFGVDANSSSILMPGLTSASSALVLGNDADLYRSAANTLKTDGNFVAGGNLTVNGATTFQNSTDSTTAFQVQNAAGTTILNVDATTSTVAITGSLTVSGSITIGSTPATGDNSNKVATTAYVDRTAPTVVTQSFTDSGSTDFWPTNGYTVGGGGMWVAQIYDTGDAAFIGYCQFLISVNSANGNREITIPADGLVLPSNNNFGVSCTVSGDNTTTATLHISTGAASGHTMKVYFRRVLPTDY